MGFTETVIRDMLKNYPTDDPYTRGIKKGLETALDIIEIDKRVNGKITIAKENVA